MIKLMVASLKVTTAALVAVTMIAGVAAAHGALNYHVIEFHYVRVGPYMYVTPYAQRNYYCDGHYEYVPGPGGSLGIAYEQTFDDSGC